MQEHPEKAPSLTTDDVMNMSKFFWNETVANIDVLPAFKGNAANIKHNGSEDHLMTSKLKALIWDYMLDLSPKTFKFTTPNFIIEIGWNQKELTEY